MTGTEVLIVGAGPTGLTLACELARRGVGFRLVEAEPEPRPGSRGKSVQARTLEVFDDLGVVNRILASGQMAMPMRTTGPDGRVSVSAAAPPARPDVPYPASLITPEWRVEETLTLRLAELGGTVEYATALATLDQTLEQVTATVVRGDRTETITARWLVGCDGGHSTVRKQAGIEFVGETRQDVRMIVADVTVDGLDRDVWHMWRHQEGMFTLCPLPSTDTFQLQASIAPGQDPELTLANMQRLLERRTGRTDLRLQTPQWTSLWRANVRLADRYREGRVLLAGDAAHIHSPAGGQGMNTGIQDAHNLGWKLAAVADGAPETLLDSYAAERRPVAAGVLALSEARLAEARTRNSIPIRRDTSTTQLDITYRDSALVADDRDETATLRAGDRAPDATELRTLTGEHRLLDLTRGGRFTLLDFGAGVELPSLRTLRVVSHPSAPDEIADTAGYLRAAYAATDRTLVLLRPDGHIGAISDTGDPRLLQPNLRWVSRQSRGCHRRE